MARKPTKGAAKKAGSKALSSEDISLWEHVSKRVMPQSSNRFTGFEDLFKSSAPAKSVLVPKDVRKAVSRTLPHLLGVGHRNISEERQVFREAVTPSARQNVPGLDRNTSEKLRKGKLVIEGRLDLHGHSRKEAHSRLRSFLGSAHRQGKRCVLVITGKGRSAKETDDAPFMGSGGKGILREEVPKWLAQSDIRRLVLDYRTAQAKHGGDGALYVLLKRMR